MQEVLLCFACSAVVQQDHPLASCSTSLVKGKCDICGHNTWCDLYLEEDVYKGKYERSKLDDSRY